MVTCLKSSTASSKKDSATFRVWLRSWRLQKHPRATRWISPKLSMEVVNGCNPLQQQPLRTCVVSGNPCSVKVPLEPPAWQMLRAAPEGQIAVLDDPHRPKLPLQKMLNQNSFVDVPTLLGIVLGLEAQNQTNRYKLASNRSNYINSPVPRLGKKSGSEFTAARPDQAT